jgi:hypothetical protein
MKERASREDAHTGKPIVQFSLFNEYLPDPTKGEKKIMFAPPLHKPLPNPYYPYMQNPYNAPYDMNYNMPVQKIYNISMAGPSGDHVMMSRIFEDVLPGKDWNSTMITLGERLTIYNYIRNTFANLEDGADIGLDGGGERNSLLSYLRFVELNPGSYSKLYNNPYKNLADGFLIYNSCYPIRYDQPSNKVTCAKNSMGINIRLYKLTVAQYELFKLRNQKYMEYDVWRELGYYEYMREEILKKKVSPNFSLLYNYFVSRNNKINFDKLKSINVGKSNKAELEINRNIRDRTLRTAKLTLFNTATTNEEKDKIIENIIYKILREKYPSLQQNVIDQLIKSNTLKQIAYGIIKDEPIKKSYIDNIDKHAIFKDLIKSLVYEITEPVQTNGSISNALINRSIQTNEDTLDMNTLKSMMEDNSYSGNCLIALTESPNNNLYKWASRTYESTGTIKKMLTSGFYNEKIWMSILFQIMAALYTMQIHEIAFRDFSIEDNIYIKDLQTEGNNTGYWKYRIEGIDYYVPNYGYLVMIDSNFKDIKNNEYSIINKKTTRYNKICSRIFKNNYTNDTSEEIHKLIVEGFKNVFNPNSFTKDHIKNGVTKPPEEIMTLLTNINSELMNDNKCNIASYIFKYMKCYLHNRIGHYLYRDNEIPNIRQENRKDFNVGDMVIYESSFEGSNVWALYLGKSESGTNELICTKVSPTDREFTIIEVNESNLREYTKGEAIEQKYKVDQKLNENDLLETYIISKKNILVE